VRALTPVVVGAAVFLLAVPAVGASGQPLYWNAHQADTQLLHTAWAHATRAHDPACQGEGGHIHAADGTPLYRYFLCIAFGPGKLPGSFKSVWLAASEPPHTLSSEPGDLADNPLAPSPPAGFRRHFWNAVQARDALQKSEFARLHHLQSSVCSGVGWHYHLVGQTVYRTFRCGGFGPTPKQRKGAPPKFAPLVNVWLSVDSDGAIVTGSHKPSGIWRR
jgi:hypothetical protein